MLELERNFNISREELDKIKEICDTLASLEMAVQCLCKENTDLIISKKSLSLLLRN